MHSQLFDTHLHTVMMYTRMLSEVLATSLNL